MDKLARKASKRIMAFALSIAMIMSNMTVFASEVPAIDPQAEEVLVEDGAVDAEVSLDDEDADVVEDADSEDVDVEETTEAAQEETAKEEATQEEKLPEVKVAEVENTNEEGGEKDSVIESDTKLDFTTWTNYDAGTKYIPETVDGYPGVTFSSIKWHNDHGINVTNGNSITLNIKEGLEAEISVLLCQHSADLTTNAVAITSGGAALTPILSDSTEESGNAKLLKVEGTSGKVKIEFKSTDSTYVHYIDVKVKAESEEYVAEGEIDFASDDSVANKPINVTGIKTDILFHGSGHGLNAVDKSTMTLNLSDHAEISIWGCGYGAGINGTVTPSKGKYLGQELAKHSNDATEAPLYRIWVPSAGNVTLTFGGGGAFIHKLKVDYHATEKYTVTLTTSGSGTATATPSFANANTPITLSATPGEGARFRNWNILTADTGLTLTGENPTFNMPAKDIEIQAVFVADGPRFEWDFATDDSLTGAENGKEIKAGATGEVEGLVITTTEDSSWDSKTAKKASVTAGTTIAVPVNGVIGESDVENRYMLTVDAGTGDYTVNDQTAAGAGKSIFVCDATDGKINIGITGANTIDSIKVAPFYYVKGGNISFLDADAINTTKGIIVNDFKYHGSQHGIQKNGNEATIKMYLQEGKTANLTIQSCQYSTAPGLVITAVFGENSYELTKDDSKDPKYLVEDASGEVTLKFSCESGNECYIHSIDVAYAKVVEPGSRNIDVWDFGAKVEENTDIFTYNNNITVDTLSESGVLDSKGQFVASDQAFGDLTMTSIGSAGRFYSSIPEAANIAYGKAYEDRKFEDGYTSAGALYINGAAGSGRRYITIADVQAGDKIVAYVGLSNYGPDTFYFDGNGQKDGFETGSGDTYAKYDFVAEKSGTYKIWTTDSGAGKPVYYRIKRVPGVLVTGTISNIDDLKEGYIVKFVNNSNDKETIATLDGNKFSAILAPGFTYTAILSGATGYGFTKDSKTIEVKDEEYKVGKSGVNLVVGPKEIYTYSGKVTGFAEGYKNIKNLDITLLPSKDSGADKVKLEVDSETLEFSAVLDAGVPYTIQMDGVDDYEVKNGSIIKKDDDFSADIKVGLKPMYTVSGGFIVLDGSPLPEGTTVSDLTFTILDSKGNRNANYTYVADTGESDTDYSIQLRNGSYAVSATVDGYTTSTHVVVNGAEVNKDILFVLKNPVKTKLNYVDTVYVGYPDKTEDNIADDAENKYYAAATVSEAMDICERMTRTPASQPITVYIYPGVYREQIRVNAENITFKNEYKGQRVLLTWYYGIGYKYYSADKDGFYNPENAYDKFEKNIAARWGVTVYVDAKSFRAEGITFENSFNRYLTDEEIEDGVERDAYTFEREYGADVESRAAIERAAVIALWKDQAEFKDCEFYSSQDTLYTTENGGIHAYFKNCVIEGNTDYIYGGGDVVFDNCELSWKGYSDSTNQGGYITAYKSNNGNDKGYLFRNSVITANEGYTVNPGYLGRTWGGAGTKVVFLNTKLEAARLIADAGWTNMNGDPTEAKLYEYNTTSLVDGETVDTSKRAGAKPNKGILTTEQAATYTAESFFGSWTPTYYGAAEEATVAFAENESPKLSSSAGELAKSKPGSTLTVSYKLNGNNADHDASIIRWYQVGAGKDGADKLIKTANPSDKTYLITAADAGKKIKVTVLPAVTSGTTGTTLGSDSMETAVLEGYDETVNFSAKPSIFSNANINVPHPGDVLTVKYSLDTANLSLDASEITWYRVKGGDETKIAENKAPNKTYTITDDDIGALIKVVVIPVNTHGTRNDEAKAENTLANAVTAKNTSPVNVVSAPYAVPDPSEGEIEAGTFIQLFCDTQGAEIYFSVNEDGNPTSKSTAYDAAYKDKGIELAESDFEKGHAFIKAIAVKEGLDDSKVVTLDYKLEGWVEEEPGTSGGDETNTPPGGNDNPYYDKDTASKDESKFAADKRLDLSDASKVTISDIKDKVYDGSFYEPVIKVTYNDGKKVTLVEGTDYSLYYQNNLNAGTASVTVYGKGMYKGQTEPKTFTISRKPIKKLKVVAGSLVEGDTKDLSSKIKVYDGNKVLTEGIDYKFPSIETETANVTKSGKAVKITIEAIETEGKTNYTGTTTFKTAVYSKADAESMIASVTLDKTEMPYTGKAIGAPTAKAAGVTPEVKNVAGDILTNKTDYKVQYKNNKDVGTAYVVVTGKGKYKGSIVATFQIKGTENKTLTVKEITKKITYNGKLQKPAVTVTDENGKKLKKNKDYYVYYKANLNAGKATVKVVGRGNYDGKAGETTFEIQKQQAKKISVKGKGTKEGIEITYSKHNLKWVEKDSEEHKTLTPDKYDCVVEFGAVENGKVTVTITPSEEGNFTGEINPKKLKQ